MFKGAKRLMLDAGPVTKQTARLNWKDFRLRATLYVSVEKKGGAARLGDAQGLWRYDVVVLYCAFFGVSSGLAHQCASTAGVRDSLCSHQGEDISGQFAHAATPERTIGSEMIPNPTRVICG
jgi:hypothetical protein